MFKRGERTSKGATEGLAKGRRPRRTWCHGGSGRKPEERGITTERSRMMKSENFPLDLALGNLKERSWGWEEARFTEEIRQWTYIDNSSSQKPGCERERVA